MYTYICTYLICTYSIYNAFIYINLYIYSHLYGYFDFLSKHFCFVRLILKTIHTIYREFSLRRNI